MTRRWQLWAIGITAAVGLVLMASPAWLPLFGVPTNTTTTITITVPNCSAYRDFAPHG